MAVDDQYTKALLHFDYGITDESGKTWTDYSNGITIDYKKFGSGALNLNHASNSYITTPTTSDFVFGTGDFTIDFWFYMTQVNMTGQANTFVTNISGNTGFTFSMVKYTDRGWELAIGTTLYTSGVLNPPLNQWVHCAVVRSSGTLKYYLNGSSIYSASCPTDIVSSTAAFMVGYPTNFSPYSYIDELRISKGIARWTSNFTPPTAPYGQIILPPKKNIIHPSLLSTSIAQK